MVAICCHTTPLVVKDRVSALLVDSPSPTTMENCALPALPAGGVTVMLLTVTAVVPPPVVYRMGLPGMPVKAELPKAEPLQDGTATELRLPLVVRTLTL